METAKKAKTTTHKMTIAIKLNVKNRVPKLAIDFADGIAQGAENVDPELLEYAKASGKPFLPLTEAGEDRAAAFAGFYESL